MALAAEIRREVAVPAGLEVSLDGAVLKVKGPKGTLQRRFSHPRLLLALDKGAKEKRVVVTSAFPSRREKALVGTWEAHVGNMLKGAQRGFACKLKIVYAHFPIKVAAKGDTTTIENFLGERSPRHADIHKGVKVDVSGDAIVVTGADIEAVGQTAANIERATRIRGFDPRVFQDGIYIVEKAE